MISEGEALILKKNPTGILFDKKMVNTGGKGFIFTANIYKNPNCDALLGTDKQNLEWKPSAEMEGMTIGEKNDNQTTCDM